MEEEKEEKKTPKPKGGKREGAGRKPMDGIGGKPVGIRIRKDYLELIDTYFKSRSQFMNEAIRLKLKREGLL